MTQEEPLSSAENYCKFILEELWISTQTLSEPLPPNSSLDSQLTELPDLILRRESHFFHQYLCIVKALHPVQHLMLLFCLPIQHLHSLGIPLSAVSMDRVGYVTFNYYFANFNYYYCASPIPPISTISPQQHWSQLQLPILSLTQKILHVFVWFFGFFFCVQEVFLIYIDRKIFCLKSFAHFHHK